MKSADDYLCSERNCASRQHEIAKRDGQARRHTACWGKQGEN